MSTPDEPQEQAITQPSPYGKRLDEGEAHNQDHAASDPEED